MDAVIANSAYTKGFLDKYLGVDAIVVEPVPPPIPYYAPRKRVGYFGSWSSVKGIQVLLKAWEKVTGAQLLLFCDPPPQAVDEGRLLYGYDNVVVMGRYSRSHLSRLLNMVDLVVVPSLNESYGLVRREVGSLGTICIATDAGGLAGEVKAGDPDALAKAIQEAIDTDFTIIADKDWLPPKDAIWVDGMDRLTAIDDTGGD
jgi:glycosyltransferase involved in cell wall biosynthesis